MNLLKKSKNPKLIPWPDMTLMILIFALEWWIRTFYSLMGMPSIIAGYTDGVTPGAVGAPFAGVLLLIMLALSLRSKNA